MKLKWRFPALIGPIMTLALTACNGKTVTFAGPGDADAEAESDAPSPDNATDAAFVSGLTEEATATDDAAPPKDIPEAMQVIHDLDRARHLAEAECAGFGDEAKAFDAKLEALKDQDVDRKTARETLKADFDAFKAVLDSHQDQLQACHQSQEGSELDVQFKATVEACLPMAKGGVGFDGRRGPGKGMVFQTGGPHGPGGPGGPDGRRPPPPPPPRDPAQLDSQACTDAVAAAKTLLSQ